MYVKILVGERIKENSSRIPEECRLAPVAAGIY